MGIDQIALLVFALVGLADSAIFGWNALTHREIEVSCHDGSCLRLSHSPYARVFFKIPNWVFGLLFYSFTIVAAVTSTPSLVGLAMVGSFIAFGVTLYLVWVLAIKLRVMCKLCYLAHIVNAGLFITWFLILMFGTS